MKTMKLIKINYLVLASIFLLFAVSSCNDDDDQQPVAECFDHFGYDENMTNGPSNWDNYCVAAGTVNECGSIERQSPINITGAISDATLSNLDITYNNSSTDIINNGHTIQFNYNGPNSNFTFNGETYSLLQFHFHAGSEHTVDALRHPLEVHLVHQNNTSGNIAVIGVFFEQGTENAFLAQFTENLPQDENGTYTDTNLSYSANAMVDTSGAYYNYSGSLTTPPCSKIVEWIVMEQPLQASQAQLDKFSSILNGNFRPVQPLNSRTIKLKN